MQSFEAFATLPERSTRISSEYACRGRQRTHRFAAAASASIRRTHPTFSARSRGSQQLAQRNWRTGAIEKREAAFFVSGRNGPDGCSTFDGWRAYCRASPTPPSPRPAPACGLDSSLRGVAAAAAEAPREWRTRCGNREGLRRGRPGLPGGVDQGGVSGSLARRSSHSGRRECPAARRPSAGADAKPLAHGRGTWRS